MRACWIKLLLVALVGLGSLAAHAQRRAVALTEGAFIWAKPDVDTDPFGKLKKGSSVEVVSRTADKKFLDVFVRKGDNSVFKGFVLAEDFQILSPGDSAKSARKDSKREAEGEEFAGAKHPWSFGAGFAGSSQGSVSYVTLSAELRYLETDWLESILGADLSFGSSTALGPRFAQRAYATLGHFRPYAHLGYRIFDARDYGTSAYELGGGFQISYGGSSFFEVGIYYLVRTPFDPYATNGVVFGGTSGVRF